MYLAVTIAVCQRRKNHQSPAPTTTMSPPIQTAGGRPLASASALAVAVGIAAGAIAGSAPAASSTGDSEPIGAGGFATAEPVSTAAAKVEKNSSPILRAAPSIR